MKKLTADQLSEIKELHNTNNEMLLEIVGGEVDPENPKPITLENASCLVAKVVDNNTRILAILNDAEGK